MIDQELQLLTVSNFIACDLENDSEILSIVEFASTIINSPFVGITILDDRYLYLKAGKGFQVCSFPRELSFCNYTAQQNNLLIVTDVFNDKRFANLPCVTGSPFLRFYAGAPLIRSDGQTMGTLFICDDKPNCLDEQQQLILKILAGHIFKIMELRASTQLLENNKQELKLQEKITQQANLRLQSFFESSAIFKVLVDKNGVIIDYNRVAYNFIKSIYKVKLQRGDLFVSCLDDEFVTLFNDKLQQSFKGRKTFVEGSTKCRKTGDIFWEASFEASRNINNEIIAVLCQMHDVTERKLKEQQILAQNQSLLNIAHIQAHEFRGPLTTIMGLIELMHEDNQSTSSQYLPMLKNAVGSLDKNINQVINHIEVVINGDQKLAV